MTITTAQTGYELDTTSAITTTSSDANNDTDGLLFALMVMIDAQNTDQLCMQDTSILLDNISEAGSDNVDTGTDMLDKDNQAVIDAGSDDEKSRIAQSQQQTDNTKVNNANQQFSALQQSLETWENLLSNSDQSETDFIRSFLQVYDYTANILA